MREELRNSKEIAGSITLPKEMKIIDTVYPNDGNTYAIIELSIRESTYELHIIKGGAYIKVKDMKVWCSKIEIENSLESENGKEIVLYNHYGAVAIIPLEGGLMLWAKFQKKILLKNQCMTICKEISFFYNEMTLLIDKQ